MKLRNPDRSQDPETEFRKPAMTKRRVLIGSGMAVLAAGAVLVGLHHEFVRHVYAEPREFIGVAREEVLDLDKDDETENLQASSRPPAPALPGLPNFGKVTETLYRGGQPTPEGYRSLQRLGVQIVVDFRYNEDEIQAGRRAAEALGMQYINIPWSAKQDPNNQQVAQFLKLVNANSGKRIFTHCHAGEDKTGVMIAAYRMEMQHWSPDQALAEMWAFGFRDDLRHFWDYRLEEYVRRFPQQLLADPEFRGLGAAEH
jgi:protein tyrosine phosphatase (PTP) superfamily phosphohydrolase (DUF442 family)